MAHGIKMPLGYSFYRLWAGYGYGGWRSQDCGLAKEKQVCRDFDTDKLKVTTVGSNAVRTR
jgi:hypothetical protein